MDPENFGPFVYNFFEMSCTKQTNQYTQYTDSNENLTFSEGDYRM